MLIHMHTQVRCISSARKLLEPLIGSKFSMYLRPIVDVPMHADREVVCQGDQQRAAGKSRFLFCKGSQVSGFV